MSTLSEPPRPYLVEAEVKDFGCVRDATLKLTRLHALIGPNDSGKSTLLRAVRTAMYFASRAVVIEGNSRRSPPSDFELGLSSTRRSGLTLVAGGTGEHTVRYDFHSAPQGHDQEESLWFDGTVRRKQKRGSSLPSLVQQGFEGISDVRELDFLLGRCELLHLDPDELRKPSGLIIEGAPVALGPNGRGLPGIYDTLINRGDDAYQNIVRDVRLLFPTVKHVRLRNVSPNEKTLEAELHNGERIPPALMSDGLLYYLAFAALEHVDPVSVLLVEEPENGLHPARIGNVVSVLRRVSERTQVIMATHSPLVINELQGEEVSVVTRKPDTGTEVRLLSETPNFRERFRVYALGELWVSYANGEDEAPLLTPPAAGSDS